jgi:hypothetical protein
LESLHDFGKLPKKSLGRSLKSVGCVLRTNNGARNASYRALWGGHCNPWIFEINLVYVQIALPSEKPLVAQVSSPVQAQAKACGYILQLPHEQELQKSLPDTRGIEGDLLRVSPSPNPQERPQRRAIWPDFPAKKRQGVGGGSLREGAGVGGTGFPACGTSGPLLQINTPPAAPP